MGIKLSFMVYSTSKAKKYAACYIVNISVSISQV